MTRRKLRSAFVLYALSAAGCGHALRECVRQEPACDAECRDVHVSAPPQRVTVDLPVSGAPPKPTPARTQGQPSPAATNSAPSVPSAASGYVAAGYPTALGASAMQPGFAAVPTVPGTLAITLTWDWIRIPIPIPRLRTIDIPPETRLSYVAVPGATGAGNYTQANVAPQFVAAPAQVQQIGYAQPAAQNCYTPEQVAAAAEVLRQRRAQADFPNSGASTGTTQLARTLAKRERELEEQTRRLAAATKKFDEYSKAHPSADPKLAPTPPSTKVDWRVDNPWGNYGLYKTKEWK